MSPPNVRGGLILVIALLGIAVNIAATRTLAKANRQSLNIEGSFQHILTDLYAFIGTAVAALVILITGFDRADPLASLLVAGLMLRSSYGLLRDSGRVFLEASPKGLNPDEIGRAMAAVPGVGEVHDLHVWDVTSGFPALSAHVLVGTDRNCHATRRQLEALLHDRYELEHTTLQVDHEGGELLEIELPEQHRHPVRDDSPSLPSRAASAAPSSARATHARATRSIRAPELGGAGAWCLCRASAVAPKPVYPAGLSVGLLLSSDGS